MGVHRQPPPGTESGSLRIVQLMYLILISVYFAWLALQNIALPWAFRAGLLSITSTVALMALKEVVMVLVLLGLSHRLFRSEWKWISVDKWALAYLAVLALYFFAAGPLLGSTVSWQLRLVALRSLTSFVLFYFLGRVSFLSVCKLHRFFLFVLTFQMAAACFGLFEWCFLPVKFWSSTVSVGNYMLDVKGLAEGWNVVDGLPSNFYRFDVRRLISVYGDPLAMGTACVFPLVACVLHCWMDTGRRRTRYLLMSLCIGAALLLTIARESIGVACVALATVAILRRRTDVLMAFAAVLLVGALLYAPARGFVVDTITFRESSAAAHLSFLTDAYQNAPRYLVGKGIGEAGGWAFSLAGVESDVGENTYVELMAQAGIISTLLFVGFLSSLLRHSYWRSRTRLGSWWNTAFLALATTLFARMLFAIFSPSFFALIPMASMFFFAGAGFTTFQRLHLEAHAIRARRVLVLAAVPAAS